MDTTLKIDGMKCGGCVASVTDALRGVAGVRDVAVSLDDGEARLTVDEAVGAEALIEAVRAAGFEAKPAG
jgi:copper chaperone